LPADLEVEKERRGSFNRSNGTSSGGQPWTIARKALIEGWPPGSRSPNGPMTSSFRGSADRPSHEALAARLEEDERNAVVSRLLFQVLAPTARTQSGIRTGLAAGQATRKAVP
jgi:hypothetical protein